MSIIATHIKAEDGFTVMELLVASALGALIMAMVIASVFLNQQFYHEDVVRTRITSNLRSSMDIISMNIRQSGEHLSTSFPAVEVADGGSTLPDQLTLRRGKISEVLTLCNDASDGDVRLYVSSTASAEPECLAGNVATTLGLWEAERNGETVRAYIYDRVTKVGEWVDYSGIGTSSGDDYISNTALENDYVAMQTNVYFLEEYRFELESGTQTLNVFVDGVYDEPRPVAFSVSDFRVEVLLEDSSTVASLNGSSAYTWKDIRQIQVTLTGEEARRKRTFTGSLSASYFPRNVLSE
jgi:hypothetical protein